MRKQLHDVEEIPRMLPVHRGDQLAAIHVFQRHHGNVQVSHQHIARTRHQRCGADRMHRAAHDEVDLDLHFDGSSTHH
jgi:hypothetical protein